MSRVEINKQDLINKILDSKNVTIEDSLGYGFSFKRKDSVVIIYPLSCAYGKVYKHSDIIKVKEYTLVSIKELDSIL